MREASTMKIETNEYSSESEFSDNLNKEQNKEIEKVEQKSDSLNVIKDEEESDEEEFDYNEDEEDIDEEEEDKNAGKLYFEIQ